MCNNATLLQFAAPLQKRPLGWEWLDSPRRLGRFVTENELDAGEIWHKMLWPKYRADNTEMVRTEAVNLLN